MVRKLIVLSGLFLLALLIFISPTKDKILKCEEPEKKKVEECDHECKPSNTTFTGTPNKYVILKWVKDPNFFYEDSQHKKIFGMQPGTCRSSDVTECKSCSFQGQVVLKNYSTKDIKNNYILWDRDGPGSLKPYILRGPFDLPKGGIKIPKDLYSSELQVDCEGNQASKGTLIVEIGTGDKDQCDFICGPCSLPEPKKL